MSEKRIDAETSIGGMVNIRHTPGRDTIITFNHGDGIASESFRIHEESNIVQAERVRNKDGRLSEDDAVTAYTSIWGVVHEMIALGMNQFAIDSRKAEYLSDSANSAS